MQWRHWRVGLMSLLALGVLAWCFFRPTQALPALPDPAELIETAPAPVASSGVAQSPPSKPSPVISPTQELPRQPADSHDENRVGMPSHPITEQHKRIYRENNLIGDLNGAMDIADVAGLRRLLSQYRTEFPEDAHVLQDGYALIADCLEHPGPELRAKAQRYYDEELASGLRRYVRRHCLEAANR